MQVGDETINQYLISLTKQLKKIERVVFGTRAQGRDGPVHDILPGNYVYVKSLSDSPLQPNWEGSYQVFLMTDTVVKVEGVVLWIQHTRLKKTVQPQWITEERGLLRVVLKNCKMNRNFKGLVVMVLSIFVRRGAQALHTVDVQTNMWVT